MKTVMLFALLSAGLWILAGCDSEDPVAGSGNSLADFSVNSAGYLNHRFFKLDLPLIEPGGRRSGDRIVSESIRIFQLMPREEPIGGEIVNVATYVDSLGYLGWEDIDFESPYLFGTVWREILTADPMLDENGELIAVDLGVQKGLGEVLAVVYEVERPDGTTVRVGDIPGIDAPQQPVQGGLGLYYRMKLLKAPASDQQVHTFQYVWRNIYSLGAQNIDPAYFGLRIEALQPDLVHPHQDENGLDYVRIFGLDQDDHLGHGFPDGEVDWWNPLLFDLSRGLLMFPVDLPHPFAPGGDPTGRPAEADLLAEASYAALADTVAFVWEDTYLRENQAWQLYAPTVNPLDSDQFSYFRIVATYARSEPG
jgi:hypothetical protein